MGSQASEETSQTSRSNGTGTVMWREVATCRGDSGFTGE